jgi:hypothetical protein
LDTPDGQLTSLVDGTIVASICHSCASFGCGANSDQRIGQSDWQRNSRARDEQTEESGRLFAGHHVGRDVIILCVRWYLRYKLSLRDLVEMMAERGLSLAHSTILRWVRR